MIDKHEIAKRRIEADIVRTYGRALFTLAAIVGLPSAVFFVYMLHQEGTGYWRPFSFITESNVLFSLIVSVIAYIAGCALTTSAKAPHRIVAKQ